MRSPVLFSALLLTVALSPAIASTSPTLDTMESLEVSADQLAADRTTGAFAATGHVRVVARPVTLIADSVSRDADGNFVFADPTAVTTCSNAWEHLHWKLSGAMTYRDRQAVVVRNAWLSFYGLPVFWLPFWYYPIDPDYGFHFMLGHTSRWGAYLMTEYVYGLYSSEDEQVSLRGRTRFDLREKNGVAAGQDFSWRLRDWGSGAFHVYYAWDDDHDHYLRHANTARWNYQNWESTVPHERYRLEFEHRVDLTERDWVWTKLNYMNDTSFQRDFLRQGLLKLDPRFAGGNLSTLGWEHIESLFGFGLSARSALNDFDGGSSRLPEFYFSVNPCKLPGLPLNYESQTRVGYYRRDYGTIGTSKTALPLRYRPGPWADYDAFRADTYQRLTMPMKFADLLSVVPRFGYHGTFWDDAGFPVLDGKGPAGSTGEDVYRSIVEGGVTFTARGVGTFDDGWIHVAEPYLDVLAQKAEYSGLGDTHRPYVFDGIDGSFEWLDQFAGRSRNLPYSYFGVTPGLRNVLKKFDESGWPQPLLDFDVYCAVQFNDTDYTEGNRSHRLSRDPADPNYGDSAAAFFPGARLIWTPEPDWTFAVQAEYDPDENVLTYTRLLAQQRLSSSFSWSISYASRDHRRWDYSTTPYDARALRDESLDWMRYRQLEVSFEHELCDAIAWGPFMRWDCQEGEADEVGFWADYRTDCLGFRFIVSREFRYDRVDRSYTDNDASVAFLIYLRALGDSVGTPTQL